jgi:hypothetical protein
MVGTILNGGAGHKEEKKINFNAFAGQGVSLSNNAATGDSGTDDATM